MFLHTSYTITLHFCCIIGYLAIHRQRASIASCGACVHYSLPFAVFHACRYSCLVVLTSRCQTRNGKLVAVTVAQPIPCQLVQLGWMAYITRGQCKVLLTCEINCFEMHNIRTYVHAICMYSHLALCQAWKSTDCGKRVGDVPTGWLVIAVHFILSHCPIEGLTST